jgi:hypothetical protein
VGSRTDPQQAPRGRGKGGLVCVTSYVIGLWLPSAIAASTLLLTLTRRTPNRASAR